MDTIVSIIISVAGFFFGLFTLAAFADTIVNPIRAFYWVKKGLLKSPVIFALLRHPYNLLSLVCVAAFLVTNIFAPDFINRLLENWGFRAGVIISLIAISLHLLTMIWGAFTGRAGSPLGFWALAVKYINTGDEGDLQSRYTLLLDQTMKIMRYNERALSHSLKTASQTQMAQVPLLLFNQLLEMGGDRFDAALITEKLKEEKAAVKLLAVEALSKSEDSRAMKPLRAMLRDSDRLVRKAATKALVSLNHQPGDDYERLHFAFELDKWDEIAKFGADSVELLIDKAKESKNQSRKHALEALGRIADPRAVEPLMAAVKNSDPEIRKMALAALSRTKDPRALGVLITELENERTGGGAIDLLVRFGSAAVDPLLAALLVDNRQTKERAAEALGKIGDSRAVESLSKLFNDTHSLKIAEALAEIGDPQAVELLISSLDHENSSVQETAASALRIIAGRRSDVRKLLEKRRADEKAEKEDRLRRELIELRQKIRVGMSLDEAIALLGPPTIKQGGGDVLSRFGSVSGSADAIASIGARQYYTWRRPEGTWELIFVGDILDKIYSAP